MKKPKVVFYKDESGGWRWSLVAANGRKLCTPSKPFRSLRNAELNYAALYDVIITDPRYVYK